VGEDDDVGVGVILCLRVTADMLSNITYNNVTADMLSNITYNKHIKRRPPFIGGVPYTPKRPLFIIFFYGKEGK
jgi:hypothetical protein